MPEVDATWYPDWSGQVCAIVASGPSVTQEQVNQLRGRCRVIVVNNNFRLAPWADVLYAADGRWWLQYQDALTFSGLKVTQDRNTALHHKLHLVHLLEEKPTESRISIDRRGYLARGGNGGFQAINLAVQFVSRRHLWIGFEFRGEHWHGKHEGNLRNPSEHTMKDWAETLDRQREVLDGLGVQVINCSLDSALTAYRKLPLEDALDEFCPMATPDAKAIDFDAAHRFLQDARGAHEAGDDIKCRAAVKLVAVALQIDGVESTPILRSGPTSWGSPLNLSASPLNQSSLNPNPEA